MVLAKFKGMKYYSFKNSVNNKYCILFLKLKE